MSFSFVFSGWVGLQNAVLQSHKLLIWPQLVQLLNHIFVIGGLTLAALMDWSITILVYAAVFGWVVMAPFVSRRASALLPKANGLWFERRTAMTMVALSFPVFLSLSLDQVSLLLGTYLGSSYPEGAISHLNYAQRLTILLSSVFALVISYVLFPYLTESIVANNDEKTRRYLALALIAALIVSAPLLILSLVMSDDLISFVFQRGAFGPEDALAAGNVLTLFAPIIVLTGVREVLNRLFLALQQTSILLVFGALAMITNVIASVYFNRAIGLEGIALGATCGALIYVLSQMVMVVALHRNLLHRDLPIWLGVIGSAVLASTLFAQWVGSWTFLGSPRVEFTVDAFFVIGVFSVAISLPVLYFPRLRGLFNTVQMI